MKKLLFAVLAIVTLVACKKDPEFTLVNEPLTPSTSTGTTGTGTGTGLQVQSKGVFMNGVHSTSGKVKIVKDADGTQRLAFEDFRTDSGPDLRVYLAEDTNAKNFIEVDRLSKLGTFSLPLPSDANPEKRKYVLIWCRAYTVLFGSAELLQ